MSAAETTTVRISLRTHRLLREIAATERKSLQEVVDEAAEALRRDVFFRQLGQAWASLSENERADEGGELEAWNSTLTDGLSKE